MRRFFSLFFHRHAIRAALVFWAVYIVVLAVVVAVQPDRRTVTPNYRQAAEKWWNGEEDIYKGKKKGFLYLPHSAILYTPFVLPPKRVGEPLWRIVSLGALAFALWRASLLLGRRGGENPFALLTALTIPASFASAGNGQMNVILSALFLHTAVDLAGGRAWRPALWLWLSFAFKPIAAVYLLLAGALYRRLWIPLLAVGFVLAAVPFVHPHPDYVLRQFHLAGQVLLSASQPGFHEFCDLSGMFRSFGCIFPDAFWMPIRAAAALGTLFMGWLALRRMDALHGATMLLALAMTYLMLFNPRTEANSYILLAPSAAILAALSLFEARPGSRPLAAFCLALYAVCLGVDSYGPLHGLTNLWLKALLTVGFAVFLCWRVLRTPPRIREGVRTG